MAGRSVALQRFAYLAPGNVEDAGARTVLACFGYDPDAAEYGEGCEVLRLP